MLRSQRAANEDMVVPKITYKGLIDQLSDEARQYLCYLDDGRLFISKSHRFNPLVAGFQGRLKRVNMPFDPQYVDLAVIAEKWSGTSVVADDRDASDMQRYAKALFEKAVKLRASDIHIRCSETSNTTILMRIHGDLEFIEEHPYERGKQLCTAIYQSMADVSDSSFEPLSRQDARIGDRNKMPAKLDGIRIATTPQVDGSAMVLRLLYNDTVDSYDLGLLGYHQTQSNAIELMKRRPTGINIIAGPTGSGKSTTLQRVLGAIIKDTNGRKHVITVEDPPEYPIAGAVQTPVTNAGTEEEREDAFQIAIKSAMRLDPDVLMIGEIRDTPSATLAVRAAMTGHQVWTTLHANGVFASIDRLLDLGVPLEILTDHTIITGLTCQRLVKVLCPNCKVSFKAEMARYSEAEVRRVMSVVHDVDRVSVLGEGCVECQHTGIVGRTVVAETVITDPMMMTYIRKRDRIGALNYWKNQQNGQTMLDHAIEKIGAGIIDPFAAELIVGPLNLGVIEADHRILQEEVTDAVAK